MVNEKLIKQVTIVFTEIINKLVDSTFKFSKGGATTKVINKFLERFNKEFGTVNQERLVDFCICAAYNFRNRKPIAIQQVFGPKSIQRMKEQSRGLLFYQDEWLRSAGLSRQYLLDLIRDRGIHPLAKFIYVSSEDSTKERHLNQRVGYLICQTSTLGWSPLSPACKVCVFVNDCQKETLKKYPEIFRLRTENDNSTK